jgi:hypothetical protein
MTFWNAVLIELYLHIILFQEIDFQRDFQLSNWQKVFISLLNNCWNFILFDINISKLFFIEAAIYSNENFHGIVYHLYAFKITWN